MNLFDLISSLFSAFKPQAPVVTSSRPIPKKLLPCKPELQTLAIQFLDACEAQNIKVCIYYGFRTYQEQADLYAQGRTKPGKIVTNARPGTSKHEVGEAFDAAPLGEDGKISWDLNTPDIAQKYQQMGIIGKTLGLIWGGDFKSIPDRPHFQLPTL